jgi:hypothetical protein
MINTITKESSIDLSAKETPKEQIKNIDKDTSIRYQVVSEVIDLKRLRQELEQLEFFMPEPTDEELIEIGKQMHPFYMQNDNSIRIAEIKSILGIK